MPHYFASAREAYKSLTCRNLLYNYVVTLFFFKKNVVFPAQAEHSYFSADFRLKIFLYYSEIIAHDISVLEYIGGISYS